MTTPERTSDPEHASARLPAMTPARVGVLALAVTAALAMFTGVAAALLRPLWLDEVVTQLVARGPQGILHAMRSGVDFQPPPHYVLVRLADLLTSDGALAARLPSVVAAALTVCLLGAMLRTTLSVTAALAGALAIAAHPFFLAQAVEARPYALWILASAGLAESLRAGRKGGAWWTALAAAAVCSAHYFGVLTLAAVALVVAVHARWARRQSWPATARTVAPLAAGALALVALLPIARAQLAATAGRSWVTPATGADITFFLRFIWGWRPALLLIAMGLCLLVARRLPAIAARWPRAARGAPDITLLALLATAAVPLLVVLVSLTYKPVVVLRYSAPALLALAALCALAVESLPRAVRWVPLLLLGRAALFSFGSMATAARDETAAFSREAQAVRQLDARGVATVSPFRHDAYRASFAAVGAPGAPDVAWMEIPDSLLDRVGDAGIAPLTRNMLLVERDFGRAAQREFGFPVVVSAAQARARGAVALLRDPSLAAADSLWFPGRVACPLTERLVAFTPGDSAASCGALQSALQGTIGRR